MIKGMEGEIKKKAYDTRGTRAKETPKHVARKRKSRRGASTAREQAGQGSGGNVKE